MIVGKAWEILALAGYYCSYKQLHDCCSEGPSPTLVCFAQKDPAMQIAKKPKKIVRLTLIVSKDLNFWKTSKKLKFVNFMTFLAKVVKLNERLCSDVRNHELFQSNFLPN